jgi:hypothetical protein
MMEKMIPITRVCQQYQIEVSFIYALQDYGLIEVVQQGKTVCIDDDHLGELERMIRLHYELEINLEGIDVIRNLMRRMAQLEAEMNRLRNRLNIYEDL